MAVNNNLNLTGPAVNTLKVLVIPLATITEHGTYINLKFLS
jgi:hypothetical protein